MCTLPDYDNMSYLSDCPAAAAALPADERCGMQRSGLAMSVVGWVGQSEGCRRVLCLTRLVPGLPCRPDLI